MAVPAASPFLYPGSTTQDHSLGIISLKRDLQVAILLQAPNPSNPTDQITNTRFGSFPHSTLLNRPWGSQVVASKVETADSRRGRKRKRGKDGEKDDKDVIEAPAVTIAPAFEAASSGFAHVLSPTPELWTLSLPHRTQVVYTPDYSFILQRLRVRPGDTIIEAGAGSGSFTHAAARAVFNGVSSSPRAATGNGDFNHSTSRKGSRKVGNVCSFEYHEPRHQQLQAEIASHGLASVVTVTHRDVYDGGFTLDDGTSPNASAIFLDLPAPWTALKHLSREPSLPGLPSPLNPRRTVRICTFSPCIEQVEQSITTMRQLGWCDITMYEMQQRRIDVRRDLTSLQYEGLRGVNATAANVGEAVARLRELNEKSRHYHGESSDLTDVQASEKHGRFGKSRAANDRGAESRRSRLDRIKEEDKERKVWRDGRMMSRCEPEIKTHTSFLVFAILPRSWSEGDEERCRQKWAGKKAPGDKPTSQEGGKGKAAGDSKGKMNGDQGEEQSTADVVDASMTEAE
jgi:tRNA (adenine57-N1/adenine58-N1)-methyltransferase